MTAPFDVPRPINLRNIEDVGRYMDEVLVFIERAWNERAKYLELVEINAEPARLYTGLTVLADGSDWDPGSGQGVYTYYNGTWNKLG